MTMIKKFPENTNGRDFVVKIFMGHTPYSPIIYPNGMHHGNIEFLDTGAWYGTQGRFRIVGIPSE